MKLQFTIPKGEICSIFNKFLSKGSSISQETQVTSSHFVKYNSKRDILLGFGSISPINSTSFRQLFYPQQQPVTLNKHKFLPRMNSMDNKNKKMTLSAKIIIAMFAGLIFGLLARNIGWTDSVLYNQYVTNGVLFIVGKLFVNSLKMLVVPMVFVSLVCGTCNLTEPSKLGRMGLKTISLYLITTAIAITIALAAAIIFEPGVGAHFETAAYVPKEAPSITQTLINLIPDNPFAAMVEGNMLQIIIFAILFGIAISLTQNESGKTVASWFNALNEVIMKLVTLLMYLAPYGVFALISQLTSKMGLDAFQSLGKYFSLVLIILLVHGLIVYPTILSILGRLNPLPFLKKMRPVHLFAFSTASSNATLPVTMEVVTKRIGVKSSTASFTLPLGATINMDGTAIMQGIATVFIAQLYGIDLTATQYLTVILMATMASIGTAGVPGVGLITLATVLTQVNLPAEGIGIILGIDRLLDMVRTAVNVTGDAVVSVVVGKSENEFVAEIFYDPNAGLDYEEVHLEKTA